MTFGGVPGDGANARVDDAGIRTVGERLGDARRSGGVVLGARQAKQRRVRTSDA